MTNQEPLTAEAMAKKWIHALYNKYLTVEALQKAFEAYAAQEVAKATTGLQSHNSLLADSLKTVIENCEHYLIGEASMGGAYVENNFTGVGHEALDATAEIIRQWESRIEMRMAFKVGDKLAAQVVELETELDQLRKGKPITHNGKEYWPDANGWYDMECAPKDGTHILVFVSSMYGGAWQAVAYWASINDSDLTLKEFASPLGDGKGRVDSCTSKITCWQPLPAGPVMEGG